MSIFGYLTSFTVQTPLLDVLVHPWPIAPLPYQVGCPFNTLMPMLLMQLMKDLILERHGEHQLKEIPRFGVADCAMQYSIFLHHSIPLSD